MLTTFGGVRLGVPPCPVSLPREWTRAIDQGTLWRGVLDGHPTYSPMPDGSGVLFAEDHGRTTTVSIMGAGHRVVRNVGVVSNPARQGQLTFNAMRGDYAAFVYSPMNGQAASFIWDLYLWNRRTGSLRTVAKNPTGAGGQPLKGGWVQPVLTSKYLYWLQATPDTTGWGGSELMQYSLAGGTTRVLYRGVATAFVPYGNSVLLTAVPPGTPPSDGSREPPLHDYAVDAATGRVSPGPAGITAAHDGPNTMTTDGDMVVWASDQTVRAWRPRWGRSVTLIPSPGSWRIATRLGIAGPTQVRLYRNFLVWSPGPTFVLDLETNSFARIKAAVSSDEMTGSYLSTETDGPGLASQPASVRSDQVLIDLRHLPNLPTC